MSQISIYVSHSIRGKKGKDATEEDMKQNNQKAIVFGKQLRRLFPKLCVYVPGDHDEFVLIAYLWGYLTEKQILQIDCDIVQKRNFVIAYTPDGYLSKGMKIEIEYAGMNGIPVIVIPGLETSNQDIISRQIKEALR